MRVELLRTLNELNGVDGDIRAVVADLFKVMHDVEEVDTGLHRAAALAKALDVAALELLLHGVHDFLKRLNAACERNRLGDICLDRHVENLAYRVRHSVQLVHRGRGEAESRLTELIGAVEDVLRVVTDLLEVGQ